MKKKDSTPDFHNRLVALYIEQTISLMDLHRSEHDIAMIYSKLINFLRESVYYEAHKIVNNYKFYDYRLYEVIAWLYNRMGKHEQALQEYIHNIKDFEKAIGYCDEHYDPEIEGRNRVYFYLVKVLLNPPNEENIWQSEAIYILEKFYKKIDVIDVIDVLPPGIQIKDLETFFSRVLQETNARKRKYQIQYNLLQSEHMRIRGNLLDIKRGCVHINEQKQCGVCKKRLGHSDFYYYPNRVTVHVGCFKGLDPSICPVTGVKFGI